MTNKTGKQKERTKLGLALLIGAACALTFCFFSVTEVFAANRAELLFNFRDFVLWLLLACFCAAVLVAAVIYLPGKKIGKFAAAGAVWGTVMGYVQSTFLNGAAGLAGDDREAFELGFPAVINILIWAAALAGVIIAVMKLKEETLRTAATVLMLMILGMQAVGFATNLPKLLADRFAPAAQEGVEEPGEDEMLLASSYLSTDGMFEAASESNVYVLILDRLDVYYVNNILKDDKDFFAPLTGFTCYRDNLSLYSRTFPGAATIIAGQDGDLTLSGEQFFRQIYQTSPLLHDLKQDGYRVKLYAPSYYTYRSGAALKGIADNLALYSGSHVVYPASLTKRLLLLSAYKALPQLFKPLLDISTQSFDNCVEFDMSSPQAGLDDLGFYKGLKENGITVADYEKAYTYLHMQGGHDPYVMDENMNEVEKGSADGQIRGDFRILYLFFGMLKEKGLYENATIIITGDHPRALSDSKEPAEPRVTALFVKEAGRSDEPFVFSPAQVSQENLAATIVSSAGIPASVNYGEAYAEVPEGENRVRWHQFQLYKDGDTVILRFKVEGKSSDFDNWSIESRTDIGKLYK